MGNYVSFELEDDGDFSLFARFKLSAEGRKNAELSGHNPDEGMIWGLQNLKDSIANDEEMLGDKAATDSDLALKKQAHAALLAELD